MNTELRVIVATDGSDDAKRAVAYCATIAQRTTAHITAIHVISNIGEWLMSVAQIDFRRIEHERRLLLEGPWTEPLRTANVAYQTRLLIGDPVKTLLAAADEIDADLIVIGKTGHSTTGELLLGGSATKLAQRTTRPLLFVPKPPTNPPSRNRPVETPAD